VKSIPKIAQEPGIADESSRRWIRQQEIDSGEREGLCTEELGRLRRENKTLRQEREFFKTSGKPLARLLRPLRLQHPGASAFQLVR
jgi:transposase